MLYFNFYSLFTCLLHRCRQFGANALYLAIATARPDVAQHLLDSGADIKAKDDVSSMTVTAQHSTAQCVRQTMWLRQTSSVVHGVYIITTTYIAHIGHHESCVPRRDHFTLTLNAIALTQSISNFLTSLLHFSIIYFFSEWKDFTPLGRVPRKSAISEGAGEGGHRYPYDRQRESDMTLRHVLS
jgi:hypothetical protein